MILKSDFIRIAYVIAKSSHCGRRKVGCVITKEGRIISTGYNAIPRSLRPFCNNIRYDRKHQTCSGCNNVIHSELNAIYAAARAGISTMGCDMYITLAPCKECAKGIAMAGISNLYYHEDYRNNEGIKYLESLGVKVAKVVLDDDEKR